MKKKQSGCISTIFTALIFVILFFSMFGNNTDNKNTDKSSINTTAKVEQTTTPEPDYSGMDPSEAALVLSSQANSNTCKTRDVEVASDMTTVNVDFSSGYQPESLLIGSVRYSIDAAQLIFNHTSAQMLYFKYWEQGRDKYGNPVDMCTVTIRLTRETAGKINFKYFHDSAARTQKAYLDVVDGYSLYKDYKAILK